MGILKVTSRFGLLLGFIALLCTAISAGIYMLTKNKIDEAMAEQQKVVAELFVLGPLCLLQQNMKYF